MGNSGDSGSSKGSSSCGNGAIVSSGGKRGSYSSDSGASCSSGASYRRGDSYSRVPLEEAVVEYWDPRFISRLNQRCDLS